MKRLIVTADDFGLAIPVNDAVEAAHLRGILTAASLMVTGAAAASSRSSSISFSYRSMYSLVTGVR